MVIKAVEDFFNSKPLRDIDPDQAVALGAALQAEALTEGSNRLLLDVTPLSLGIETMGGVVEKLIPRNSPIPISKKQEFTTYQDNQTAMKIHVVQGERDLVDQCRSLAHFDLTDIPPLSAGAARIEVTYSVDADGLLTVSAQEKTTGVQQRVEVKPSYGLSEAELAAMLQEARENAEQDLLQKSLSEAKIKGQHLLKAVETALKSDSDLLSPEKQTNIKKLTTKLREKVASSNQDAITESCRELERETQDFAQRCMNRSLSSALTGKDINTMMTKSTGSTGESVCRK